MKEIRVGPRNVALVDDEDFEWLSEQKWCIKKCHGGQFQYARTYPQNGGNSMHRIITGCEPGMLVDHINGNTLDNRRSNLRIVSYQQNARNRVVRSDSRTGVKGVTWSKQWKTYQVFICLGKGAKTYVGCSRNIEEAKSMYLEASIKHFGDHSMALSRAV